MSTSLALLREEMWEIFEQFIAQCFARVSSS